MPLLVLYSKIRLNVISIKYKIKPAKIIDGLSYGMPNLLIKSVVLVLINSIRHRLNVLLQ